jgi:hypothetical protein
MRLLLLFLVFLTGCGGYTRIGLVSNPGSASINGVVSVVHVVIVSDGHGGFVTVTAVTLIGSGAASNLMICGDQRDQFPMDQTITATFDPGNLCATLVTVQKG